MQNVLKEQSLSSCLDAFGATAAKLRNLGWTCQGNPSVHFYISTGIIAAAWSDPTTVKLCLYGCFHLAAEQGGSILLPAVPLHPSSSPVLTSPFCGFGCCSAGSVPCSGSQLSPGLRCWHGPDSKASRGGEDTVPAVTYAGINDPAIASWSFLQDFSTPL